MPIPNWLYNLDKTVFVLIHNDSDHQLLDNLMLLLRNPYTWIPFYAFMLYFAIKKCGNKTWQFLVMSLFTFFITDAVCARVWKPMFQRLRPCYEPSLHGLVRNIIDCGGLNSFPSNHAANHFGLAAFWYWSVFLMSGQKWNWLWIWAAAISYAQVYVGKHYPSDVIAGAIFGYLIGITSAKLFHRWAYREKKLGVKSFHNPESSATSFLQNPS